MSLARWSSHRCFWYDARLRDDVDPHRATPAVAARRSACLEHSDRLATEVGKAAVCSRSLDGRGAAATVSRVAAFCGSADWPWGASRCRRSCGRRLDVEREDVRLRDKYGRGTRRSTPHEAGPLLMDEFLVARRLIEAGARCVT